MTIPTSVSRVRPDVRLRNGDRGTVGGSSLAVTVGSLLAVVLGVLLFIGGLVVIAAGLLAVFVVSLCVVAVRGAAHALHPHRSTRVDPRASHPTGLIDATATVRPVSAPKHTV